MQIMPNSTIKMCKGVPIDNSYKDTIYFSDKNAQYNYFNGKVKSGMVMTSASYQRIKGQEGVVRFGAKADNLYDCNYMMFQNTNYGSKWFYAFVTNVEYVNDNVSNVYFVIDVMQTWFLFDCTLKESFVSREHSASDEIGDCLIPEGINGGEYVYDQFNKTNLFSSWSILILSPYDNRANKTYGTTPINGVASGCNALVITDNNYSKFGSESSVGAESKWDGLTAWLLAMSEAGSDSILSISMIPTSLLPSNFDLTNNVKLESYSTESQRPFSARKPSGIGNYVPKNNKLLTYPYTFLGILDCDGNMGDFHYELFKRDTSNPFCTFEIQADFVNGYYTLIPVNYKNNQGTTGDTNYSLANTLTMSGVPQCSYTLDAFKIWWAQNKVSMMGKVLSDDLGMIYNGSNTTVRSTGTSLGTSMSGENINRSFSSRQSTTNTSVGNTPDKLTLGINLARETIDEYATIYQASKMPNYTKGGGGNSNLLSLGYQDFMYGQVHIQEEVAKTIDDYFTMFGYATKRVKVPNINVRPHWTYTQTTGCTVLSDSCNATDINLIQRIFDKGITFWKNASEVGNYSLNNKPT